MNNTAKTTILALAIIGAAIMSGCLGGDPVATTNYVQPSTTIEQATPQESNDLELQLNETAHNKHTIVIVDNPLRQNSYSWEYCGMEEDILAPQGKVFIFVFAGIGNMGLDRDYRGAMDFSLTDSNNRRYDAEICLDANAMELMQELYKDQIMTGWVMFEVPEDATGLKVQYDFGSVWSGTKLASWDLNM